MRKQNGISKIINCKRILFPLIIFLFFLGISIPEAFGFDYVLGTAKFTSPLPPQPAQWQSYIDPDTGIAIRRITDIHKDYPNMTASHGATIEYVRKTPLSSNGRWLVIATGSGTGSIPFKIIDLQTHTIKDAPHISTSIYNRNGGQDAQPEYRWDYSGDHPNRIYYRYGWEFYYGEVDCPDGQEHTAQCNFLVHNFRNDTGIFGSDAQYIQNVYLDTEGDSSGDSRYWAWEVSMSSTYSTPNARKWIIVYDNKINSIIGKLENTTNQSVNFVDMAPDGSKVVVSWQYGTPNPVTVYNLDFSNPVKLCGDTAHSGWAYDLNGKLKWLQINSCGGDYLRAQNLETYNTDYKPFHQCYLANSSNGYDWGGCSDAEYLGHHFQRTYGQLGWALLNVYASGPYWGNEQVMAVELKNSSENPRIWRILNTYNSQGVNPPSSGGSTAPQASITKDGTKIYFSSNWRGTDNFEVYEATLPKNWWCDLNGSICPVVDAIAPNSPKNLHFTLIK